MSSRSRSAARRVEDGDGGLARRFRRKQSPGEQRGWIGGHWPVGGQPIPWKFSSIVWKSGSIEWKFSCRGWHVVQCARNTGGGRVFNPSVFGRVTDRLGLTDSRYATCPSSIPPMWVVGVEPRASICRSAFEYLQDERTALDWRARAGRGSTDGVEVWLQGMGCGAMCAPCRRRTGFQPVGFRTCG